MLSKKHFEKLAAAMRETGDEIDIGEITTARECWHTIYGHLVVMCKEENRAFDRDRFEAACGINRAET